MSIEEKVVDILSRVTKSLGGMKSRTSVVLKELDDLLFESGEYLNESCIDMILVGSSKPKLKGLCELSGI